VEQAVTTPAAPTAPKRSAARVVRVDVERRLNIRPPASHESEENRTRRVATHIDPHVVSIFAYQADISCP
jgi:hypothetical protein